MVRVISNTVSSAATNDLQYKWKKNADVSVPMMEYLVAEDRMTGTHTFKMRIQYRPHKSKQWHVEVAGVRPAFFEGNRSDVKKMQQAAEAMYAEWLKSNPPTKADKRANALQGALEAIGGALK